ncbi:MAG: amidohydrolase family protein, partial [Stellaceae bacterium]
MPEPLQPAPPRRIIRNATWLVAWDQAVQSHVYRRDVDLTVKGDTVAAIGPAERADDADAVETDGRGFAVLPGFVDIHAHPSSEPMLKGLTDEVGSRQLYMSSLYEYLPLFEADPEGRRAATEVALCELMQSGVTTVCDLSAAREDWLDTLGASGMRVYAAPMFRSGRWYTPNGHEVRYTWDEQAGREGLDRALRVIDRARQHPSGRLDGVLYPAQVDTCTEALLRDSAAAARERRLPFQIHAAQSVVEFHEIMRRHSRTPIEWLREIGVLGANAIIGHAIFLDHHPWLHWPAGGQQQIRSPSRLQRSRRSPRYSPGSKRRPASPTGSARRRSNAAGAITAISRGTESSQTHRWREMDSNHRFPVRIKHKEGARRGRSAYPAHGRQQDALAERGIRTLLPVRVVDTSAELLRHVRFRCAANGRCRSCSPGFCVEVRLFLENRTIV